MTLRGLRDYVIPTYQTRLYVFLHLSAIGLTVNRVCPSWRGSSSPRSRRQPGR